jgi:sugar phosphate isomerase/epimerase
MEEFKSLSKIINPTMLVSELFFYSVSENGSWQRIIKKVIDDQFYGGVEIGVIIDASERHAVRNLCARNNLVLTQWISPYFIKNHLSLTSFDKEVRKHSIKKAKELIAYAAESGAKNFALISGDDPGAAGREEALKIFKDSLIELCEEILSYQGMTLLLEPVDRGIHKNQLIGPTSEAVILVAEIKKKFTCIGISWDSAHVALMGESLTESLEISRDYISQIHLANAILDKKDPNFGDHHMKMGAPGFLTASQGAKLIQHGLEIDLFSENRIGVSLEVRSKPGEDPWAIEHTCRDFLFKIWERLEEEL